MEQRRLILLDNLRGVLVILVVLGHVLERFLTPKLQPLYFAIYSFHVPALAFLSGLCFRRGKPHVWKRLVLPYLLFQMLYRWEAAWEQGLSVDYTFGTPEWVLWYLLALALWQLAANSMELRGKSGLLALALSVAAGLLVGYDTSIGYHFSLSRAITWFPFFLAGTWLRENHWEAFRRWRREGLTLRKRVLWVLPGLATQLLLYRQRALVQNFILYGAMPYKGGFGAMERASLYLTAACAIAALVVLVPRGPLPLLSAIGRRSMSVYLLHGLLLRYCVHKRYLYRVPGPVCVQVAIMTALLVLVCASPPVTFVMERLQTWSWPGRREKQGG